MHYTLPIYKNRMCYILNTAEDNKLKLSDHIEGDVEKWLKHCQPSYGFFAYPLQKHSIKIFE
jgi:hypothetical protein